MMLIFVFCVAATIATAIAGLPLWAAACYIASGVAWLKYTLTRPRESTVTFAFDHPIMFVVIWPLLWIGVCWAYIHVRNCSDRFTVLTSESPRSGNLDDYRFVAFSTWTQALSYARESAKSLNYGVTIHDRVKLRKVPYDTNRIPVFYSVSPTGKVAKSWATSIPTIVNSILISLTMLSGVVSAVWLLRMGEWEPVVGGLVVAFLMPWVLIFVGLPGRGLSMIYDRLMTRGSKVFGGIFAFMALFYSYFVFLIWTLCVFTNIWARARPGTYVLLTLWGYSVMSAPMEFLAYHEGPKRPDAVITVIVAQLYYVIVAAAWFSGYHFLGMVAVDLLLCLSAVIMTALTVRRTQTEPAD